MASLLFESGSRTGYRLQSYDAADSRRRHSIWLGDISAREAETIKRHIEAVIESQKLGTPMPGETLRWLGKLPVALRRKLTPVLGGAKSVGEAIDAFTDHLWREKKESTQRNYARTLDLLRSQFGNRQMRSLTAEEIDLWSRSINVSSNTAAKYTRHLQAFINWCKTKRWVDELQLTNSRAVGVGEKRFIVADELQRWIDAFADDPQMHAAMALSRWLGIRVPSELVTLTVGAVDFESKTISVIDSKRSIRSSRAPPVVRVCPLFPELIPYLERLWDSERLPTDPLLPDVTEKGGGVFVSRCREARDRLGLRWLRLFTSVRATRETELIRRFGIKAACDWIGNSPDVAMRHYEQVTADEWKRATDEHSCLTTREDRKTQ
jgi:integrase